MGKKRTLYLEGKRFGRLTVLNYVPYSKYLCRCDCGNLKTVTATDLHTGKTQSCGCLQKERTSNANTKHGKRHTRLYNIWCGVKSRCYYTDHVAYARYGGRGIAMCEEWRNDFKSFYDWSIRHGYSDDLTLDRIDNNKGYSPDNCRWATYKEQFENSTPSEEFLRHMGSKREKFGV